MPRKGFSLCTPTAAVGCCLFLFSSSASAKDLIECVQSVDHNFEGQLLTEEEKYQILLQRLADDQIRFEECLHQINIGAAVDGRGTSGGGIGGTNSSTTAGGGQLEGQSKDGSQTFATALESISASGVQGTELPEPANQITGLDEPENEPAGLSDFENQDELSQAILNEITPGGVASSGNRAHSNGMRPEELEVSDNDAILLSQILAAANAEQDPDKKKKLMEEYRRMRSGNSGEPVAATGGQQ